MYILFVWIMFFWDNYNVWCYHEFIFTFLMFTSLSLIQPTFIQLNVGFDALETNIKLSL